MLYFFVQYVKIIMKMNQEVHYMKDETMTAAESTVTEAETAADSTAVENAAEEAVSVDDSSAVENKGDEKKGKSKRKRRRIYDVTKENDIRYSGPLSYRWFKILGWLTIVFAQYVTLMKLKNELAKTDNQVVFGDTVNSLITSLALPLLLFSGFALIMNGHGKTRRLIMTNGLASLGLILGYLIVYQRYVLGIMSAFFDSKREAALELDKLMGEFGNSGGFIAFNIFLDLLLCILIFYFATYTPKKHFKGNRIYIFRSFVVLPILYEFASICLKILASNKAITIPVAAYPFLTTKPPMAFLMFCTIVVILKGRERRFLRHGKTIDDYHAFLKTNTNSLHFSIIMAVLVVIFAIADLILCILFSVIHLNNMALSIGGGEETRFGMAIDTVMSWGFGQTFKMIFIAPLLLLFSYTKTHKRALIDILIPIAGILGIVFVYIESTVDIVKTVVPALFNS